MNSDFDFNHITFTAQDTGDRLKDEIQDQLRMPEHHPKDVKIHSINWPDGLTPPYKLDVEAYSVPDEPVVRTLNMIQGIIVCCRQIDSTLISLCDDGVTKLRRMQQGADEISVDISQYTTLATDRGDQPCYFDRLTYQREYLDKWRDEAMPRFEQLLDKLYQWVDDIHAVVARTIKAIEDAYRFQYNDSGWISRGSWEYDPLPTNAHIAQLESSYEEYRSVVYDVDLEKIVNGLYEMLETPKEANDELGFE